MKGKRKGQKPIGKWKGYKAQGKGKIETIGQGQTWLKGKGKGTRKGHIGHNTAQGKGIVGQGHKGHSGKGLNTAWQAFVLDSMHKRACHVRACSKRNAQYEPTTMCDMACNKA